MAARTLDEAIAEMNGTRPELVDYKWRVIAERKDLGADREAFMRRHGTVLHDYLMTLRYDAAHDTGQAKDAGSKALMLQAAEALAPLLEQFTTDDTYFEKNRDRVLAGLISRAVTQGTAAYSESHAARLTAASNDLAELSKKHHTSSAFSVALTNFSSSHSHVIEAYAKELRRKAVADPKANAKMLTLRADNIDRRMADLLSDAEAMFAAGRQNEMLGALQDAVNVSSMFHGPDHAGEMEKARADFAALVSQHKSRQPAIGLI